jgi:hypothetical protein
MSRQVLVILVAVLPAVAVPTSWDYGLPCKVTEFERIHHASHHRRITTDRRITTGLVAPEQSYSLHCVHRSCCSYLCVRDKPTNMREVPHCASKTQRLTGGCWSGDPTSRSWGRFHNGSNTSQSSGSRESVLRTVVLDLLDQSLCRSGL